MQRSDLQSPALPRRSVGEAGSHLRASALLAMLGFAALTTPSLPAAGSFAAAGSMTSARYYQTATLLGNGKVLITGGVTPVPFGFAATNSAELFDPASGTCTSLSPSAMTTMRNLHTATLLPSGKVLIAGGLTGLNNNTATNTAELFDPASGSFTSISQMTSARSSHTATLLPNGKVLITGGVAESGTVDTAELFDPASGSFTSLSSMSEERASHTATVLPNGKVLIAGGYALDNFGFAIGTNTAELFDPASGTFTSLSPTTMTSVRYYHTATVLGNGKVLLAGGFLSSGVSNTAELFDPASATFTSLSPNNMSSARGVHTATLLPNGKVLITGGQNQLPNLVAITNTAELFDPASGSFQPLLPMTSARSSHTATLLTSGEVLIAGGYTGSVVSNTTERFDPTAPSFTSLANTMISARERPTALPLPSGKVLIVGGRLGFLFYNTAELFDPVSQTFTLLANTMTSARYVCTATLLATGKVLIAGGHTGSEGPPTNSAELFDPASGTFMALPPMTSARIEHTTTLLPSGKVLIAGGTSGSEYLNTAELFEPASGTFTSLSPHTMASVRFGHTATLLPSGKVLITGGITTGYVVVNTAELFDPVLRTFTSLANTMTSARYGHKATLLQSGKVLIVGGYDGTQYTNTAELFDPATGSFLPLPSMAVSRYLHTASLLPSGKVLIAGGNTDLPNPLGGTVTNTAELFDPVSQTFLLLPLMSSLRGDHTATLLPSGKVLIAGGFDGMGYTNTAELFDEGLGFSDARRPIISTAPDAILQPASLALSGTGFRGDSEAAGGSFQSSATNYPVLQLQRIDNEQVLFALSDPATNWSDTTFSSATLGAATPIPTGHYRVTIITNAIPSLQKIISITAPSAVPLQRAASRKIHGSAGIFDIDLPLEGNPGIECRSGGATNDYTIVFFFANPLTSVSGAAVTNGSGSVNSGTSGINPSDHSQYIVNLTGVANAQYLTVTLSNVRDELGDISASISQSLAVLVGDVTANGTVSNTDVAAVKTQVGAPVTSSNFRNDVNTNGVLSNADVAATKARVGALP